MTPLTPARRLALLDTLLQLRAGGAVPAGREAAHAAVQLALDGGRLQPEGSALPDGDRVGAMFFDDAARLHGIALLAEERPLPLLCLCESSPWRTFTSRPELLGIESLAVDGHDVEALHAAALTLAAGSARDGRPRLLELLVARADGADLGGAEECAAWMPCDPVALQTSRLLAAGIVSPGELLVMHQRAAALRPVAVPARRPASALA